MIISNNKNKFKEIKPRYKDARRALVERGLLFKVNNFGDSDKGFNHSGGMTGKSKFYKLVCDSGEGESVDLVIRDSGIEFFKSVDVYNSGNCCNGENSLSMGMSKRSRKRLIKKTILLEIKGYKPSHMLTVTLPKERWEKLNDSKVIYWKRAKRRFLKRLREKFRSSFSKWGVLWFMEFQRRGAPHLHFLLDLGKLNDSSWKYWLDWFVGCWRKAIDYEDMKSNAVEFKNMKKNDFRYCRNYASKMEQKNAPFVDNWGKWWSCMGEWNNVKDEVICSKKIKFDDFGLIVKGVKENNRLGNCIDAFLKGRTKRLWLIWEAVNKDKLLELGFITNS